MLLIDLPLPQTCTQCYFHAMSNDFERTDNLCYCQITHKDISNAMINSGKRAPFCPLVETTDKFVQTIPDIPEDYRYDTETKDVICYRHKYTGQEIQVSKNPIHLKQVVRPNGTWVPYVGWDMENKRQITIKDGWFKCSSCGMIVSHKPTWPFCQNCGNDKRNPCNKTSDYCKSCVNGNNAPYCNVEDKNDEYKQQSS